MCQSWGWEEWILRLPSLTDLLLQIHSASRQSQASEAPWGTHPSIPELSKASHTRDGSRVRETPKKPEMRRAKRVYQGGHMELGVARLMQWM